MATIYGRSRSVQAVGLSHAEQVDLQADLDLKCEEVKTLKTQLLLAEVAAADAGWQRSSGKGEVLLRCVAPDRGLREAQHEIYLTGVDLGSHRCTAFGERRARLRITFGAGRWRGKPDARPMAAQDALG